MIVLTGNGERENALRAMELGAYDYCGKPADLEELRVIINRAHHVYRLRREGQGRHGRPEEGTAAGIIGRSPAIREVLSRARKVAASNT